MDLIAALLEEGEATELAEKETDYSGKDFSDGIIRDSSFSSVRFNCADFSNSVITDTVFDSCDFSNADFSSSSLLRVRFTHCKLTGTVFYSSRLRKTIVESSAGRYVSFDKSALEDVVITDSDFPDSSFASLIHKKLELSSCNLSRSDFRQTSLASVNLTSSSLSAISLSEGYKELKGAKIDVSQALDIVKGLGVELI